MIVNAGLPSLSTRSLGSEVMDQPGPGRRELGRALAALARLNWWSG